MEKGFVHNLEDITKEKLDSALKAGSDKSSIPINEKAKTDILYLLMNPDKVKTNDITPDYKRAISQMMDGMIKQGTQELLNEPSEDETTPAPTGYDETLFLREKLPTPRTQKYRKTPQEMELYFSQNSARNKALKERMTPQNKPKSEEMRVQGNECYKKKDYKGAFTSYCDAIEMNPNEPTFYTNRAATYINAGFPLMAVGDCDRALASNPGLTKAYIRRGNSLVEAGKLVEALAEFEQAISLDAKCGAKERLEETLNTLYRYKFNDDKEDPVYPQVEIVIGTELGKLLLQPAQLPMLYATKRFRHDLQDMIDSKILVPPDTIQVI